MASTYSQIATQTLGSATASITFSSIPQTYTNLVLIVGNLITVSTGQGLKIRFNSDTATNYSYTHMYGNGTTAGSGRVSNTTSAQIGWGAVGASGTLSNVIAQIPQYANATTYKTVISRSNDSAAEAVALVSLWRSTAAINTVSIFPSSGNLQTGTTATLYGIKGA